MNEHHNPDCRACVARLERNRQGGFGGLAIMVGLFALPAIAVPLGVFLDWLRSHGL